LVRERPCDVIEVDLLRVRGERIDTAAANRLNLGAGHASD
jgi:hypothetical protein